MLSPVQLFFELCLQTYHTSAVCWIYSVHPGKGPGLDSVEAARDAAEAGVEPEGMHCGMCGHPNR